MLEWLHSNETLIEWLVVLSIISLVAILIIVPLILTRLPADYFSTQHQTAWSGKYTLLRIPLFVAKNCLAVLFIFAGFFMLVLPGQGILTILVGLILLDFPGKYRVERWVLKQRTVLKTVNWVRKKWGKPVLIVEFDTDHASTDL